MISQADYARHSGLTKGRVSQLVKAGMPLRSFEEADRWRGTSARPVDPASVPDPTVVPPADSAAAGAVTEDSTWGAYERQRQIERAVFGLAAKALKTGALDAGRLVSVHAQAAANLVRARQEVLNLQERERTLVTADWVRRVMMEHDGAVVALVKAMPRTLAGRIAPHDPQHAEAELTLWVEETFLRTLNRTTPFRETNTPSSATDSPANETKARFREQNIPNDEHTPAHRAPAGGEAGAVRPKRPDALG